MSFHFLGFLSLLPRQRSGRCFRTSRARSEASAPLSHFSRAEEVGPTRFSVKMIVELRATSLIASTAKHHRSSSREPMLIRLGYDIQFDIPAAVPMVAMLHVHPSRTADLQESDELRLT